MPRSCFVPGCKNGTYKDRYEKRLLGEKIASLFKAPKTIELRKKWSKVISSNKELSANDHVCEDHFDVNDILRTFETKLADGTISKINRGKIVLKPNAIPIFSFSTASLITNNNSQKRESSIQIINYESCAKKIKLENIPDDCHYVKEFTFWELSQNLMSLQKPNKMWGVSFHENFIICARWTENFIVQKLVVLDVDLKYKVFLYSTELTDAGCEELSCIADVDRLLERVEKYVICTNILNGVRNPYCEVLMSKYPDGLKGRPRIICKKCFENKKPNVFKSR